MQPIPQKDNQHVDAMACVASLVSLENPAIEFKFVIHNLSSLAIADNPSDVAYCYTIDSDKWYSHILRYLTDGAFLDSTSKNARARIHKLAARYIILSNVIYRRGYHGFILYCLNRTKIQIALEEAHLGACGGNFKGKTLVQRLLQMGYYWQTMEKDSFVSIKKCHQCSSATILFMLLHRNLSRKWPLGPFQCGVWILL